MIVEIALTSGQNEEREWLAEGHFSCVEEQRNTPMLKTEDATTERLAELLRAHQSVRDAFVEILDDEKTGWAVNCANLRVRTQVSVPAGRIDLLLDDGDRAIIVECKVDDRQKVYQLEKYSEYWASSHREEPQVFWLTRRQDAVTWGAERYLTGQLTWNGLHDGLTQRLNRIEPFDARAAIEAFLQYLDASGILLRDGESPTIYRRDKGLTRDRAFPLLKGIAEAFPDCEHKIDEENELPYRLLIGRKRWATEFKDQLVKKVRVFLEPDPSAGAGFFLWPRICLYHWQEYLGRRTKESEKHVYFRTRFPQWTSTCSEAGLILVRNAPGKTRRAYNRPMEKPYSFDPSIQVLLAEEAEQQSRTISAVIRDDTDVIRVGTESIARMLKIVDSLRR